MAERQCVEDLRKERANCSFSVEEMTELIYGGAKANQHRRRIRKAAPVALDLLVEKLFVSEPGLKDELPPEYLSHKDLYANELRKACLITRMMNEHNLTNWDLDFASVKNLMLDGNPLSLHQSMFYNSIKGQADDEQQKLWLEKIKNNTIIGTYAQTELGHGTNVRELETTATYDPASQEFVLHSPTITAIKWWPGNLGKTANYAMVMAQLIIKGKNYGPHPFMAPLRDLETHRSLPGVTLGEIGPRLGLNSNDNGFLKFNLYRIPRRNMFMKFSKVLEDGTYVKPLHSKLPYITLVKTRVNLVYHSMRQLMTAVTIATRYSAVRRQSELVPGEPEPQILDFQTQQFKLIPEIASVFAMRFLWRSLLKNFNSLETGLDHGKTNMLPDLHALSCGLKAMCGFDATAGVDTCRLSCGGHGYLASSNLPRTYGNTTCIITYDGENTVMLLQVARYLMKCYQDAKKGKPLQPSVAYLALTGSSKPSLSNEGLVEGLKRVASAMMRDAEKRLHQLIAQGRQYHHAWNECTVQLVNCAKVHVRAFMFESFVEEAGRVRASDGVHAVLQRLCRLYLVYHVLLNCGSLLRYGALRSADVAVLEEEQGQLLAQLRPDAVALVDAFDIPDELLCSTLGAWDGNVYERLFQEARKSPLNQTDVPAAFEKYLQPLMKANL